MSWLDPPSAWRSPMSAIGSTTLPWRTPSATDHCSAALLFLPRKSSPATLVILMFRHWSCLPGKQVNQPLLTHHGRDKNFWPFTSWEVQVRREAPMIMQSCPGSQGFIARSQGPFSLLSATHSSNEIFPRSLQLMNVAHQIGIPRSAVFLHLTSVLFLEWFCHKEAFTLAPLYPRS